MAIHTESRSMDSPLLCSLPFSRLLAVLTVGLWLAPSLQAQEEAPEPEPAPSSMLGDASRGALWNWVDGWGEQEGKTLGSTHGCMVVDKQGRILVNTDTEAAVIVFNSAGEVVETFGKEFRGGLHGMAIREEGDEEFLYLAHTGRHEVVKTTLEGDVLWTLGYPEEAGIYKGADEYRPTAVAVAPDGRLFVGDGYGKSWVHIYDKDRNYVKSIGGRGKEDGKFQTPHGLWMDTRKDEPLLMVADRENSRLQWFTLDGKFVKKVTEGMGRPCSVYMLQGKGREGWFAVADLTGRVAIMNDKDKLVCLLGDNAPKGQRATNRVKREDWKVGRFFAPHSVTCDAEGSLYVMDWNALGRVSKLEWALDD